MKQNYIVANISIFKIFYMPNNLFYAIIFIIESNMFVRIYWSLKRLEVGNHETNFSIYQ